jgi:hypothetical protein
MDKNANVTDPQITAKKAYFRTLKRKGEYLRSKMANPHRPLYSGITMPNSPNPR